MASLHLPGIALALALIVVVGLCRWYFQSSRGELKAEPGQEIVQPIRRHVQALSKATTPRPSPRVVNDKGASAKAALAPLFIKLDLRDDGKDLPRAIFQHPDDFSPEKDDDGRVRTWGIYPPEDRVNPGAADVERMARSAKDKNMYGGVGPETRFIRALIERKIERLEATSLGDNDTLDYVLRISLKSQSGTPGRELWHAWRRVKVSGGLSLCTLADKIITPAMGWTRNYHCHYFIDYRDGALLGPEDFASFERVKLIRLGHEYTAEAPWKVAHLLSKPGDTIGWLYDFGSLWEHTIKVEAIRPKEESTGTVEVIDGSGACPAEDCGGIYGWDEVVQQLRSGTQAEKREALRAINDSMNYSEKGRTSSSTFDPTRFHLENATAAVKDALSLPGSFRAAPKQFSMPIVPGGPTIGDYDRRSKKKKQNMMKTDMGNGFFMEESTTTRRDGVSARACSNCGTPHGLSLDVQCRAVYYCGPECQRVHWIARHKRECKQLASKSKTTRSGPGI